MAASFHFAHAKSPATATSRADAAAILLRPEALSSAHRRVAARLSDDAVLENTVEDKVAFCAKYGIKIMKEQWSARHRPVEILGDRRSLISKAIDRFVKAFNVTVPNTPPYRPDWKGIVERIFG